MNSGTIEGKVLDKHDHAQTGATVTVIGLDLTAISDMGGAFRIADVPAGRHSVSATNVLHTQTKDVDVRRGETSAVEFRFSPL